MKAFSIAACLGISSVFASEDEGRWNYSTKTTTVIWKALADGETPIWSIISYSAFDADNGIEYFRLEHELEYDIKSTDKVTFELNFLVDQDQWTNKEVIMEDVVRCQVI